MYSVTDGSDSDGYWTAAFGDHVRFVIADGTEISQGEYAASLLMHLGAPVLGAATLTFVAMGLLRQSESSRGVSAPPAPTDPRS